MLTEQEHREAITESQFREYAEFDYDFGKFEDVMSIERTGSAPETWEVIGAIHIDQLPASLRMTAAATAPADGYVVIKDIVIWDHRTGGYEIEKTLLVNDPQPAVFRS